MNARRGSEVARLQLTDWKEKNTWIDTEQELSKDDIQLLQRYCVISVMGKIDELVPVFIPNELSVGIDILANKERRRMTGVDKSNIFLFPYTQ